MLHLFKLYYKHFTLFIISCVLLTASSVLQIVNVYIIQALFDQITRDFRRSLLDTVAIVAITAVIALFGYAERVCAAKFSIEGTGYLRTAAVNHIIMGKVSEVEKYNSAEYVSRINYDVQMISDTLSQIPDLIGKIILFLLSAVFMFVINKELFIVTTVIIPVTYLFYSIIKRPVKKLTGKQLKLKTQLNEAIKDMLDGMDIVKSFNLQNILAGKYSGIVAGITKKDLQLATRKNLISPLFFISKVVPLVSVPIAGGFLVFKHTMTLGGLVAFINLVQIILSPVEFMINMITQFNQIQPSIGRVLDIYHIPTEPDNGRTEHMESPANAISFNNVSFSYGDKAILDHITLNIQKGQTVAFVGPSGSGKSTLLNLICGFYTDITGTILMNNQILTDENAKSIRERISLVTQDSYLYPATVFENISCGKPDADREKVMNAAKIAEIHDFIMTLPQKYNMQITEGGRNLSGGQRQRIALARAIFKNSPILILDEATSSLDPQTESMFLNALKKYKKGRTTIIVAHRLRSIVDSDMIYVIDNGMVAEYGSHTALMNQRGLYHKLYRAQYKEAAV